MLLISHNYVVKEMNNRMSRALYIDEVESDSKIQFQLLEGGDCDGLYFYEHGESFVNVPNALNIYFWDLPLDNDAAYNLEAYTYLGGNFIHQKNVLNKFLVGYNETWTVARSLLHEFGHTVNLHHTFYCFNPCNGSGFDAVEECCGTCSMNTNQDPNQSCWQCSEENLIMNYGINLHFTECEFKIMWNFMLNTPKSYQTIELCDACPILDIVYDLNDHIIWTQEKIFTKNIVIKSGTTIEILCDVLMGENTQIKVEPGGKLIVNGGKISNLCDEYWVGIKGYGGNLDFDIKITNGAIIENTKEAAVSFFAPEPWPAVQNFGNGILLADNSTFNNVHRLVAMMAWSPSLNTTSITDCVQNGGRWGVTNWNCIGVEIKNNVFNDIEYECIVTYSGQFDISNNEFHSSRTDILFANTSPGFGTDMYQNYFNGLEDGMRSIGTTFAQNEIYANNFTSPALNIVMDGINDYYIHHNLFSSEIGVAAINNGNHGNRVQFNDFDCVVASIFTLGENPAFSFIDNCFETEYTDVYIQGKMGPIGSQGAPANNCFTHQGNINSAVYDISGTPDPFYYFEPNDESVDCRDAIKSNPNVSRVFSGIAAIPGCSILVDTIIPPVDFCHPIKTLQATFDAITGLEAQIINTNDNTNLSDSEKDNIISSCQACIANAKSLRFEIYLKNGQHQNARDIYTNDETDDEKVEIYTSYIYENDIASAHNYLNSIVESSSEKLTDFISIQRWNLDFIQKGPMYFAIDSTELDSIKSIALKPHVYAGYAKAFYYQLTDIILKSSLPNIKDEKVIERSGLNEDKTNNNAILVYPNPADATLMISTKEYKGNNVIITNISGKIVYNTNLENNLEINTASWKDGFYLLTIKSKDKIIRQEKIIISH